MVVVAVLSVVLAVWVVPAERQRRTVATIEAGGGAVLYDYEMEGAVALACEWLARLLGRDYVANVGLVDLHDEVGEQVIASASRLESLQFLYISESLTDAQLGLFSGHTEMRGLYVNGTGITDRGVEAVAGMRTLETLWMNDTRVGDEGLARLSTIHTLTDLRLDNTSISDRGLAYVGLLANLRVLSVAGTGVTDSGLANLQSCTQLEELVEEGTNVTDSGVRLLRARHPQCLVYGP